MPSSPLDLADLQSAFRASSLAAPGDVADPALVHMVMGAGLDPAARLAVHRNNTQITLTAALAANFPVVERLVGTQFFNACAGVYLRDHPPGVPMLARFGHRFPDFLQEFPPAASLPYLPDVARLERAWNAAWHAPEAAPVDPGSLEAIGPEVFIQCQFHLHPSVQLLRSDFPVDRIVVVNREEMAAEAKGQTLTVDPPISLDAGGVQVMILRTGAVASQEVEMHSLSPAGFALIGALANGTSLGAAMADALAVDPQFELGPVMALLLSCGAVQSIDVA